MRLIGLWTAALVVHACASGAGASAEPEGSAEGSTPERPDAIAKLLERLRGHIDEDGCVLVQFETGDYAAPAEGWDVIHASHTFHEIQMYYPMRVYRDREYKIIWNIAHGQPYPFASDLWAAATWQAQWAKGKDAPYGGKTVDEYVNRPAFELYAIGKDPSESNNLAGNPEHADLLKRYQEKLKAWQKEMNDPWIMKWRYE